jgi:KTSC domain-containing protein
MIIKLPETYYHYCEIPAGIVSELRSADSTGRYCNTFIRGNFDWRINRVPPYK